MTNWTYDRTMLAHYNENEYVIVPDEIADNQRKHDKAKTIFPAYLCTGGGNRIDAEPVTVRLDGDAYGLHTPGTGDMIVVNVMTSEKIQEAFNVLFQVWEGTPNADEILQDALRTVAHRVFGLSAPEIDKFEERCRGY